MNGGIKLINKKTWKRIYLEINAGMYAFGQSVGAFLFIWFGFLLLSSYKVNFTAWFQTITMTCVVSGNIIFYYLKFQSKIKSSGVLDDN